MSIIHAVRDRLAGNEQGLAAVREIVFRPNKCNIELQMFIVIPSAPILQNPLATVIFTSSKVPCL